MGLYTMSLYTCIITGVLKNGKDFRFTKNTVASQEVAVREHFEYMLNLAKCDKDSSLMIWEGVMFDLKAFASLRLASVKLNSEEITK